MESERALWDQRTGREDEGDPFENIPEGTTSIYVNGSYIDVDPGDPFVETIVRAANNARLGKFVVVHSSGLPGYSPGIEIEPDDPNLPETFDEGVKVELRPYDEAS
jgi:hypothetical protein